MSNLTSLKYIVFNSLIGEIAIVWNNKDKLLKQIILPDVNTGKFNYGKIDYHGVLSETEPDDYIMEVMSDVKEIIMGKDIHFDYSHLDFSILTDFQRIVLLKQKDIPHGRVTSYKKLAELIDKPKSARPVANVLSSNPFPIVIPCHRTVRSDWTIGGYVGMNDGLYKRLILENEGVQFEKDVVQKKYRFPSEDLSIPSL
ncbi:MAG: methylated-DNA--[protein]-cysteine S-methyltransferase [Methanosphaera sp.]